MLPQTERVVLLKAKLSCTTAKELAATMERYWFIKSLATRRRATRLDWFRTVGRGKPGALAEEETMNTAVANPARDANVMKETHCSVLLVRVLHSVCSESVIR